MIWSWPGAAAAGMSRHNARSSIALPLLSIPSARTADSPAPIVRTCPQQVMLDVFRALPRYRGVSRLSTWIYSLALRRVADHFRSPHRREVPSGSPGDETFPPSPPTAAILAPEEQAVRREEDWRMSQAVARLAQPERAVVLAYYLGEMPVAEIARALGIPEGTVKTRLHRGRRMLRKELGVP